MNIQDGTVVKKNVQVPYYNAATWAFSDSFQVSKDLHLLDPSVTKQPKMIIDYKKMLFAGYIKGISKRGFRSYKDICGNEECYKEDFIYSVEKYKDEPIGTPIQQFYIPVVRDLTTYVDTQVKYGQTYIYKCKSHYIIIGNKYQYENLKYVNNGKSYYATVEIKNTPSVIVLSFDLFSNKTKVIQPPPVFPQVKFVSENNSKSKVDVYLTPTKGEVKNKFIKILPVDQSQVNNMNINYGSIVGENEIVTFKTFEEQGKYEIFKTNSPPMSYDDFKNNKVADVSMDFLTSDAVFRDCVKPNTEHNYFMFRKINSKGLVSNPSAIYKVKLLIDADDSSLFVSEYEFPKKIKSIWS